MVRTSNILSIQSHVAYGYVGNRAAVFPLQRMGHEVSVINTVQFSNHTGYGDWTGEIFSPSHIQAILQGLNNRGALNNLNAILSGYLGSCELGKMITDTLASLKQSNPDLLYCCDPVLGDVGRGIYVRPEVAEYFKTSGIIHADIITPNQFELDYLAGCHTKNIHEIVNACKQLRQKGPKIVLVTSVITPDISEQVIDMLVDTEEGSWVIRSPKLLFDISPNGAGDATAAIFLAKYLETENVVLALEHTMSAIFAIFKKTFHARKRELQLIAAQDEIIRPQEKFKVERVQ